MFGAERDIESLQVRLEVLNLSPTNDGENIRRLLHHIRNGHYIMIGYDRSPNEDLETHPL